MLKKRLKSKIVLIVIGAILVLIFWSSVGLQEEYARLVVFFEGHVTSNPVLSLFIFLVLTVLSVLFFFFSSFLLVPVAISVWGSFTTTMLLLLGWFIGAIFSYAIGRYAGYPSLQYFISKEKLGYYDKLFSENCSLLSIFLLRLTFPSEIPGYMLGVLRFHFPKYLWVTMLAEVPYAFVIVYAFDAILTKDPLVLGSIIGVWLLAVAILVKLIYKKTKKQNEKNF